MTWNADIIFITTMYYSHYNKQDRRIMKMLLLQMTMKMDGGNLEWHVIPEAVVNTIWAICWAVILQLCMLVLYAKEKSKF